MITGYNTDVRYGDLVLHVQTEDKGQGNPYIESLIYYGGQVVVAKRASYADYAAGGKGKDDVQSLMDHQHRMMIKAIHAGKFDEKIRAFVPDREIKTEAAPIADLDLSEDGSRTLDQVILEYLTHEAEREQLLLLLDDSVELSAGTSPKVVVRARSSKSGEPVEGTKINVRMISTFGGPRQLGVGETDAEGIARVAIQIPSVEHGTAALIISGVAEIGQAELKHLL